MPFNPLHDVKHELNLFEGFGFADLGVPVRLSAIPPIASRVAAAAAPCEDSFQPFPNGEAQPVTPIIGPFSTQYPS